MQRTFNVELNEDDADTVWRMAAASGVPAAQIVRHLHRTTLFKVLSSLAHDDTWTFAEDRTGRTVADADRQEAHFRSWTQTLLDLPY